MRDCPHCGRQISFKTPTCPDCGGAVEDADELKDTRPALPPVEEPEGEIAEADFRDTIKKLPAFDGEIQEPSVLDTLVDQDPALADTLIDKPPLELPPGINVEDTLVEIREDRSSGKGRSNQITFSDLDTKRQTGAAPLDARDFESTRDMARRTDAERHVAVVTEERLLPTEPVVAGPRPRATLAVLLSALSSVAWILLAALAVAQWLRLPPATEMLAALPFPAEALVGVPAALTLGTLVAASVARARVGVFFLLLLWVVLAGLPGVGLLLGLFGALRLIVRNGPGQQASAELDPAAAHAGPVTDRLVGWMLLFYTLCWQAIVAVIVLTRFRSWLPW
jgi:hypothetical protein